MKQKTKYTALAFAALLALSGCSMGDDKDKNNGTANASDTTPPTTQSNTANEDSMDSFMTYMKNQGVNVNDMKPIDQMDFAAHEGRSFTYNGNTAYLYRLKSDDESMKTLLDSAKKNGTVKVNMDGKEQEYSASVNGNYLFVYKKDADMKDFVTALGNYVPGATTTTPNKGGDKTTPTNGTADENEDQKDGNSDNTGNPTDQGNPTETED